MLVVLATTIIYYYIPTTLLCRFLVSFNRFRLIAFVYWIAIYGYPSAGTATVMATAATYYIQNMDRTILHDDSSITNE